MFDCMYMYVCYFTPRLCLVVLLSCRELHNMEHFRYAFVSHSDYLPFFAVVKILISVTIKNLNLNLNLTHTDRHLFFPSEIR